MKITDFDPRWIGIANGLYTGFSFLCPHCRATRIAVLFEWPIDRDKLIERGLCHWPELARGTIGKWKAQGDSWSNLTVSPSINVAGHWHGEVINGELLKR